MSYDPTNIFAKILRGEVPCHKVYEDADTIAFLDVMPQAPGHTLVVPKTAARNILDADPEVLARLLPVAQQIARAAMTAFAADGISVFQYSEAAGGQSVFHLHVHVVPRHSGVRMRGHTDKMEDGTVLAANAEKLRRALAA
ncbi:MAG: HIT family protein [Hyphomicrobium sp.]